MTTTTLKATSAAEFLALIPALLGYQPTNSIVIVPFSEGKSIGGIRLDTPPAENTTEVAQFIVGTVCKIPGADALSLVTYGDPTIAATVAHETRAIADLCGLHVMTTISVTADGWTETNSDDERTPLPPLPEHLAAMITEGDQLTGATLPNPDPALAAELAALGPDAAQQLTGVEILDLFEDALTWTHDNLDAAAVATLLALLARPVTRDIALTSWALGRETGERAAVAQILWLEGEEFPAELAAVLFGEGENASAQRIRAALATVREIATLATDAERAGALAAAAWLAWAQGGSTHAVEYARQAVEIDAEQGLAEIVLKMVSASRTPEWIFTRR